MKRALVIANPVAGRGRGADVATRARGVLEAAGFATTVEPTWPAAASESAPSAGGDAPAAATLLARRWAGDVERIVVVGGDGTVREVVDGLGAHAATTPVAIVPLGNGNILAREIGAPDPDAEHGLEWISGERTVSFDVGRAAQTVFLAVASVGFDVVVTHVVDWVRRRSLGGRIYQSPLGADLVYVLGGLIGLGRIRPSRFRLTVDGAAWPGAFPTVWVANTRNYAKGWSIAPSAAADDGWLDVQACRKAGPFAPVRTAAAARAHREAPRSVSTYGRARRVRVESDRPFRWQADGDVQPAVDTLDIEILPAALRLIEPG